MTTNNETKTTKTAGGGTLKVAPKTKPYNEAQNKYAFTPQNS